jgi:hypothetical protein
MDAYVNFVISIACQHLFLMGQLKEEQGRNIFQALVVSRPTCASMAFAGFLSCGNI